MQKDDGPETHMVLGVDDCYTSSLGVHDFNIVQTCLRLGSGATDKRTQCNSIHISVQVASGKAWIRPQHTAKHAAPHSLLQFHSLIESCKHDNAVPCEPVSGHLSCYPGGG